MLALPNHLGQKAQCWTERSNANILFKHGLVPNGTWRRIVTECWSILPAYTKNGVLYHLIWKGSINTTKILAFLKKTVLLHCNAYSEPQSVLLMDNCSIHHNETSFILFYHQNADVEVINDDENSNILIRSSIYTICAYSITLSSSFYLPTHQTSILLKSSF